MTAVGAARVSLATGLVVLALKLVAWRLTGSVALYSDALESIVNVVAGFVVMSALNVAALPPDENHPWGHSKAEYFSAGAEGVLVLVAAAAILWESVGKLFHPVPLASLGAGSAVSLAATALNGGLGLWLRRVGRRLGSPALVADGTHVLADVITTVGVLGGLLLAKLTGWWLLDPLVACAVALEVLRSGWHIVRGSIGGLMDESVPQEEMERVSGAVRRGMGAALEFHGLRARRAGPRLFIELHLVVPGEMSVARSHAMCDDIENCVKEEAPGAEVTVHVEPETERSPSAKN
jgi:cation diffusion facilitator family transporter